MKQHLVLILALVVGVLALGPAVTAAETPTSPGQWEGKRSQSLGRTVSYENHRLRVAVGARGKRFDYVIDKGTRCAYARGNRATTMPCSRLAQKRYLSKLVRVVWRTDARKRRVAVTLAVILSPRR